MNQSNIYYIDVAGDVCCLSGNKYFFYSRESLLWLYWASEAEVHRDYKLMLKNRTISKKSLILRGIPEFYWTNTGNIG